MSDREYYERRNRVWTMAIGAILGVVVAYFIWGIFSGC
jgi:hypothetical protein